MSLNIVGEIVNIPMIIAIFSAIFTAAIFVLNPDPANDLIFYPIVVVAFSWEKLTHSLSKTNVKPFRSILINQISPVVRIYMSQISIYSGIILIFICRSLSLSYFTYPLSYKSTTTVCERALNIPILSGTWNCHLRLSDVLCLGPFILLALLTAQVLYLLLLGASVSTATENQWIAHPTSLPRRPFLF